MPTKRKKKAKKKAKKKLPSLGSGMAGRAQRALGGRAARLRRALQQAGG